MSGHSPNVRWEKPIVTREQRAERLGVHGATLWFTGLPASGKSTLAAAVEARLVADGRFAYRLDGDNLRHGICGDLGFDKAARAENVRRAAHVARLFADAGAVTLVSLVSPYAEDRANARQIHALSQLPFLEIWVSTPLEECERRDPKGLYARARRGEISDMTGIDQPYEPPANPDLEIRPGDGTLDADVGHVIDALRAALA